MSRPDAVDPAGAGSTTAGDADEAAPRHQAKRQALLLAGRGWRSDTAPPGFAANRPDMIAFVSTGVLPWCLL